MVLRGPLSGMYGTLVDMTKDGGHPIIQLDDGVAIEMKDWHTIELASVIPPVRRIDD